MVETVMSDREVEQQEGLSFTLPHRVFPKELPSLYPLYCIHKMPYLGDCTPSSHLQWQPLYPLCSESGCSIPLKRKEIKCQILPFDLYIKIKLQHKQHHGKMHTSPSRYCFLDTWALGSTEILLIFRYQKHDIFILFLKIMH